MEVKGKRKLGSATSADVRIFTQRYRAEERGEISPIAITLGA